MGNTVPGMTCQEIMYKAKCSINTARKYIHKRGVVLKRGPRNVNVIPMATASLVIEDIKAAIEKRRAHPAPPPKRRK